MFLLVATIIFWNISSKVLKIYHQVFCNSENLLSSINSAHRKFHSDIQNRMAGNNGTAPPLGRDYIRENSIYLLFIHFFNYYFPYNYNYFYYYYYYYYYWFIYLSQVKLPVSPGSCFMFVSVKLHHFHFWTPDFSWKGPINSSLSLHVSMCTYVRLKQAWNF